jgi:Flp pilus assembly protein TadD
VKLRPDYAEAYNNIAAAYRANGNWDAATEAARQALRLRPDFKMAQENLARSQMHKQDPTGP